MLRLDSKLFRNPQEEKTAQDGGDRGRKVEHSDLHGREAGNLALDDGYHLIGCIDSIGKHKIGQNIDKQVSQLSDFSTSPRVVNAREISDLRTAKTYLRALIMDVQPTVRWLVPAGKGGPVRPLGTKMK